jgi:hypothetical protein
MRNKNLFWRGAEDRLGVSAILFLITWKGRKSQKRKDDWRSLAEKFKVQGFKVQSRDLCGIPCCHPERSEGSRIYRWLRDFRGGLKFKVIGE